MNEGKPPRGNVEALEWFLAHRGLESTQGDRQTDRKQHSCQLNSIHIVNDGGQQRTSGKAPWKRQI